jgi:hypothetical protein
VQRLDIARPAGIIAKRLPKFLDACHERGIAYVGIGPHRAEQFFFGNDFTRAPSKERQQRKGLGRKPYLAGPGHQSAARLKTEASERKWPIQRRFSAFEVNSGRAHRNPVSRL